MLAEGVWGMVKRMAPNIEYNSVVRIGLVRSKPRRTVAILRLECWSTSRFVTIYCILGSSTSIVATCGGYICICQCTGFSARLASHSCFVHFSISSNLPSLIKQRTQRQQAGLASRWDFRLVGRDGNPVSKVADTSRSSPMCSLSSICNTLE